MFKFEISDEILPSGMPSDRLSIQQGSQVIVFRCKGNSAKYVKRFLEDQLELGEISDAFDPDKESAKAVR